MDKLCDALALFFTDMDTLTLLAKPKAHIGSANAATRRSICDCIVALIKHSRRYVVVEVWTDRLRAETRSLFRYMMQVSTLSAANSRVFAGKGASCFIRGLHCISSLSVSAICLLLSVVCFVFSFLSFRFARFDLFSVLHVVC
eukprot:m.120403 g.120403  ORF g.120403 m.120403 type:complete len:143 (+) comp52077_c0_seq14:612-1040(+)